MKITKSLLALAASALLAVPAFASRTDIDTLELRLGLNLDFIDANGTAFNGDIGGGYYVRDGLMVGARLDVDSDEENCLLGFFFVVEQHLNFDEFPVIPYVGTDLGVFYARQKYYTGYSDGEWVGDFTEVTTEDSALAVVLRLGAKYFLTEFAALDFSVNLTLATDDIFTRDDNKDPVNYDVALRVALRYCMF